MGRKLDALLGRNFKASKFKTLVKLAISRIGILKKQHQVRCSQARSDVVELLNLNHQDRALLRVERVIKEQNMVDAFAIMETYCHDLMDRLMLIQKNKECPDELKEATSSLMFASSRCGEFPELLHIREVVSSTFGKEFVARAVELRNNCSVHPKMIQKLSTRQPSMESKLKVLKEIASERGITLHLEVDTPPIVEEKSDVNEKKDIIDTPELGRDISMDEKLSESIKARKKYRDVGAAAQEAFESAAYAAAAAMAAVELSRTTESQDSDLEDQSGSSHKREVEGFEKIHPIHNYSSESEGDHDQDMAKATTNDLEQLNDIEGTKQKVGTEMAVVHTTTTSSSDSDEQDISSEDQAALGLELAIDRVQITDNEEENDETKLPKSHDLSSDISMSLRDNEDTLYNDEDESNTNSSESLNLVEQLNSQHSHVERKGMSRRTRRQPRI